MFALYRVFCIQHHETYHTLHFGCQLTAQTELCKRGGEEDDARTTAMYLP